MPSQPGRPGVPPRRPRKKRPIGRYSAPNHEHEPEGIVEQRTEGSDVVSEEQASSPIDRLQAAFPLADLSPGDSTEEVPPATTCLTDRGHLVRGCEKHVVEPAKFLFRSELPRLNMIQGDERLRQAFYIHRDSICVPFLDYVNESLFNMPLTDHDDDEADTSAEMLPWIREIIIDQAAAFQMSEQEFGSFMASGFAHLYNEAVRENNEIVFRRLRRRRSALGRARRAISPHHKAAHLAEDDHQQQAERMASLWRKFCFAYSLYDPSIARSLRS